MFHNLVLIALSLGSEFKIKKLKFKLHCLFIVYRLPCASQIIFEYSPRVILFIASTFNELSLQMQIFKSVSFLFQTKYYLTAGDFVILFKYPSNR